MSIFRLGHAMPHLPPTDRYWVAPGAQVIGDVTLGLDVGIWFNAVLRGDNEPMHIGAGTNIQDGAVLHSDVGFPLSIGSGCTIGHGAIVHGCSIGNSVLVGMGATILNGVVIGDESIVGANTLVTGGKSFPPRSLIMGAPATLVRVLDDAAVEGLRQSASHYIANWKRFAAELTPL